MDFKNNSIGNATPYTYYAGLVEWDYIKCFYLVFHILLTFIGPGLLYSIVWYERFSSDIRSRTLMNQMLGHMCILSIIDCLINRTLYVSIIYIGPYSTSTCEFISFLNRFFFLIRIMELSIRQLIRYFYIFQWKYLVSLNDDFFAFFFTICNLALSFLFIFTLYQLGFHNGEIDYHICTGKQPKDNMMEAFLQMKKFTNTNLPLTFDSLLSTDAMNHLTRVVLIMLALIGTNTWVYGKKIYLTTIWNRIKQTRKSTNQNVNNEEYKSEDTKNVILGASGTLAIIVLIILLSTPAIKVRNIAKIDPASLNYGSGRLWNYISRFSLPFLNYCLLPIIIIGSNSKMRKTLKREIKDSVDKL
jgi:hypothetical protein